MENILTSNQPNTTLQNPSLFANFNQFIYSQEVTSCIWQVIMSAPVCLRVRACSCLRSLACSSHVLYLHVALYVITCGQLRPSSECDEGYCVHPSISLSFTRDCLWWYSFMGGRGIFRQASRLPVWTGGFRWFLINCYTDSSQSTLRMNQSNLLQILGLFSVGLIWVHYSPG